jgi:hypothetical protein
MPDLIFCIHHNFYKESHITTVQSSQEMRKHISWASRLFLLGLAHGSPEDFSQAFSQGQTHDEIPSILKNIICNPKITQTEFCVPRFSGIVMAGTFKEFMPWQCLDY